LGTPITVQQPAMRHGDIPVTMNYGDAVGEGLQEASAKVRQEPFRNRGTEEHLID